MDPWINEALRKTGISGTAVSVKNVAGGDINNAYRVDTKNDRYFIKAKKETPEHFFEAERAGLLEIQNKSGAPVPEPFGTFSLPEYGIAGLTLEWLDIDPSSADQAALARVIADVHAVSNDTVGFRQNTYIGDLKQPNSMLESWLVYYRDYRLKPQIEYAERRGFFPKERAEKTEKLMEQLHRWIPETPQISLLHGDLWGGNWLSGPAGTPYLIDPSVLYGDREMDIAFTKLFGGFSPQFYEVYEEKMPLAHGASEREKLYQLFYLLVHLNMFGEIYGSHVDRILAYYAS